MSRQQMLAGIPNVAGEENERYGIRSVKITGDQVVSTDGRSLLVVPCVADLPKGKSITLPSNELPFPDCKNLIPDYSGSPHHFNVNVQYLIRLLQQMGDAGSHVVRVEMPQNHDDFEHGPIKLTGIEPDDPHDFNGVVGILMLVKYHEAAEATHVHEPQL